jgi:hypothetical protein
MVNKEWLTLLLSITACNVDSTAKNTGGVEIGTGDCPNGAVVVMSDWISTQIALTTLEGKVQSSSILSSGSSKTDGLAFPLSGDVVVPSTRSQTMHVVLLDRFGTNVISWLNPETAQVDAQLPVGTGFESNPQDYLELNGSRAYVSRWGENAVAGQEDFDQGSDILVVDPSKPAITGRIALPRQDELPPRPTRMTRIGDLVFVALQRRSLDFGTMGTAGLVGINTKDDSVAFTLTLNGLKDCAPPIVSPDEKLAVTVCSGEMNAEGAIKDLGESAVVTIDTSVTPPKEIKRYAASDLLGVALQSDAAFASDSVILLKTQSAFGGTENNQLFALDLLTGTTTQVLEASADPQKGGKGLVYGGLLCSLPCSTTCLLADKDAAVLQRIDVTTPNRPKLLDSVEVDEAVGLPPTGLGLF